MQPPLSDAFDGITLRRAGEGDLSACAALDLTYETDYVWQVDLRDEYGAIALSFRTGRLPRPMRVTHTREPRSLDHALQKGDYVVVAQGGGRVRGYLHMRIDPGRALGWIVDMGVGRPYRREHVGSGLFNMAYQHARDEGLEKIIIETQTKNYPGICFCQKHGLVFCGYNDRHYRSDDIALFFGASVR